MKKPNHSICNRREFLQKTGKCMMAGALLPLVNCSKPIGNLSNNSIRRFHLNLSTFGIKEYPEILKLASNASVTDIWIDSFKYGRWFSKPQDIRILADQLNKQYGFNTHIINIPLGHPGKAIGTTPSTPPGHWKNACTVNGELYSGTSLHSPAVKENVNAMRKIQETGFNSLFIDDDFRIAKSPGTIGGCFCDDCRNDFMNKYGYPKSQWEILIDSVRKRSPSDILQSWIEFWDDRLYSMFTAMQQAAPKINLGIMIMYLGSEKAGFSLNRYKNVPFRVGELMFSDREFDPVKGKTDELFSSLFHRRFAKPELAYSETTAFPNDALSGPNIAAKLTISLISDVRNTMFMSGALPFPADRWSYIAPAMKKSAELHKKIAGHELGGPFKHYWGWDSRIVGKDKPFSLFLASGIPFEVVDDVTKDGWIFLSNEDAKSVVEGRVVAKNNNLVIRNKAEVVGDSFIKMDETMDDIFAFKKRIIPTLKNIPYVDGVTPVIFAWYPTAGKALLWNVNKQKQKYNVKRDGKIIRTVSIESLDVELISEL